MSDVNILPGFLKCCFSGNKLDIYFPKILKVTMSYNLKVNFILLYIRIYFTFHDTKYDR